MHGLRGHPRKTWEGKLASDGEQKRSRLHKLKKLKPFSKHKRAEASPAQAQPESDSSSTATHVFWPEDYLLDDIPQARVWTYGYDADVIEGLFKANNKNSVSQHGRDLAVRLEREIDDKVAIVCNVDQAYNTNGGSRNPYSSWPTASVELSSKTYDSV